MTAANAKKKHQEVKAVGQLTCKDFLMLDESFKPIAVTFAEEVTKKDKIVDPIFDVQGIEKVVPVLLQKCNKAPQDNFVKKLKHILIIKNNISIINFNNIIITFYVTFTYYHNVVISKKTLLNITKMSYSNSYYFYFYKELRT